MKISKQMLALVVAVVIISGVALWYKKPSTQTPASSHPSQIMSAPDRNETKQTTHAVAQPQGKTQPQAKSVADADKQNALVLYNTGLKLYFDRNFTQALSYFNQAISIDPGCYQAINGKGATYAFQGRYDEGINLIQRAISMNPNFEYAEFNLGLANELAGRWDTAIAAYQKAIEMNSKDEWAYYGIASIYGRWGNVTKVVQYLKQAIAINPDCKLTARDEKDFNPVRNSPEFENLIQ